MSMHVCVCPRACVCVSVCASMMEGMFGRGGSVFAQKDIYKVMHVFLQESMIAVCTFQHANTSMQWPTLYLYCTYICTYVRIHKESGLSYRNKDIMLVLILQKSMEDCRCIQSMDS